MPVAGVDGCRDGWVAVVLEDGRVVDIRFAALFADLLTARPDVGVWGVDMPVGLSEDGPRTADRLARERLGPRRSSVFSPPLRPVLDAPDYETAKHRSRDLSGRALSRQAWALAGKIREVDEIVGSADARIVEIHPELAFATMAGAPLAHAKRTWSGLMQRLDLLRSHGIVVPPEPGEAGFRAAPDDLADAAAVAWVAARFAAGTARSLPDPPDHDSAGREMAVWY